MRHETKQHLVNATKIVVVVILLATVFIAYRVARGMKFYEYRSQDKDSDGLPDFEDSDMDGDGLANIEDDDADGNGIPNLDDIVEEAGKLAAKKHQAAPFGMNLGDLGRKLCFFRPVDAVLFPYEKAGIYLDIVNAGGMIPTDADRIKTCAALYKFVEERGEFWQPRTKFELPEAGEIVFFGEDFCALVIDAKNITVDVLVCDRSLGLAVTTVQSLKNSGYKFTSYGSLELP